MGARKKNRTRFEFQGEFYLWYFDDWRVRIYSEDKSFVVAYFIGDPWGEEPHLEVIGKQFPGIVSTEPRPVRLQIPKSVTDQWSNSLGAFVNALLRWCFQESHEIERFESSQGF